LAFNLCSSLDFILISFFFLSVYCVATLVNQLLLLFFSAYGDVWSLRFSSFSFSVSVYQVFPLLSSPNFFQRRHPPFLLLRANLVSVLDPGRLARAAPFFSLTADGLFPKLALPPEGATPLVAFSLFWTSISRFPPFFCPAVTEQGGLPHSFFLFF